jgi:DNA invertase Pin-like site-specific DNA recombinase
MIITCPTCGNDLPGREYLRVSTDKSGRQRSPEEQHADHKRVAPQHGICLCDAQAYEDLGSASPYARTRKGRKDFDKLIADIEKDRFGAAVLVMWDSSRGSRKLSEWAKLIELLQEHGIKLFVYTHNRILDLDNSRDMRGLQEDGVDSQYAAAKISEGVTRAAAANAVAGRWHGRIPFGYKRLWANGKTTAQVPEPREAAIVRELFDRVQQGHSFRAIAKDFEMRGFRNDKGGPFSAAHLRALVVNPTYIGLRVHDPKRKGRAVSATASTVKGNWPPLVPEQTFHAVQHIITAPERKTCRPGRGIHLLSMIARCGVCDGPLAARTGKNRQPEYTCHHKGCIRVNKAELDAHAEMMIVVYIERTDLLKEWNDRDDTTDAELAAVRGELAEVVAEVDELARQVSAGVLSVAFAARTEPGLQARIVKLERRVKELATPHVLHGLLGPKVHESWKRAPISTKREVVRLVSAGDKLGPLRVLPTGRGHRLPVEDRVSW